MRFNSTGHNCKEASIQEALYQGFAPDGGLYVPTKLPFFSLETIMQWKGLSFPKLSAEIGKVLFPNLPIESIIDEAFTFPLPFLSFRENTHLLELFHGPTLSFKDIGARFLSSLLRRLKQKEEKILVLVATSGDTGSAIGSAFLNQTGLEVYILYPKGRVTRSQQQQLTTMGGNVTALEVRGSFEECQQIVKQACLDPDLAQKYIVTTGNSINIGRLFPQAFYYFYAFLQLEDPKPLLFSVPCGNFGHLASGVLAKQMGLPVTHFIAATNINDEVPIFLRSGIFLPHSAYQTIAVSMDVGNPSNFPRLLELYHHSIDDIRREVVGISFTDDEIKGAIRLMEKEEGYLLDPHSATAYLALKHYRNIIGTQEPAIFFATAHPGKFLESVGPLTKQKLTLPKELKQAYQKKSCCLEIENSYMSFKESLR